LLGDADQLQQIIANLLTNARQALEQQAGARRVQIGVRAIGPEIEIAIADNGPGVAPDHRKRIFDPYFTTKPAGMGTGIGLAVSRGIAEAHGGSLTLTDTPHGACFVLRLPRAEASGEKVGIGSKPTELSSAAPRRSLIVDDETEMAKLREEILRPLGFACDHASNGIEAQGLLRQHDYHAILCDLRMPVLGGAALYEWMKSERSQLCARIAFITGDALGQGRGVELLRTERPILEKPFHPDAVRTLVGKLVAADQSATDSLR
jgi:two-component system NtrC family sensor kinase